MHGEGAVALNS